ncbi:MAG TPA: hypothetical protein VG269_21315 [Tepidisphaeraceae bacterium]|nr:hypothetical protein [Tepidisphaeraceae bacterium]
MSRLVANNCNELSDYGGEAIGLTTRTLATKGIAAVAHTDPIKKLSINDSWNSRTCHNAPVATLATNCPTPVTV